MTSLPRDVRPPEATQASRVTELLFGDATVRAGKGPGESAYLLLPRRNPRVVVPMNSPAHARAGMLDWPGTPRPATLRTLAALLAVPGAMRLARVVRRDPGAPEPGLLDHLRELVPDTRAVAVRLGSHRPNAKPVIQLQDRAAHVVGYAKVGHDPVTTALVRHEAEQLDALARARASSHALSIPRVLASTTWGDRTVVVQSVVAAAGRATAPADDVLLQAMLTLSRLDGPTTSWSVRTSPHLARLRRQLGSQATSPEGRRAAGLLQALVDQHGQVILAHGRGHGDFTRWNCAALPHQLALWDWERSQPSVPVGLDAIHYHLPPDRLRDAARPWHAVEAALADAADLLDGLGVPPSVRHVLASHHLADLMTRHLVNPTATSASTRLVEACRVSLRHFLWSTP